jgi:hypothetical protein
MFVPSGSPPDLVAARLRGLRFSLNSPVVGTEEIPAGPARAALLVHRDARGRLGVALCIRSLRTGSVVLYRSDERLDGAVELSVGIDAALSFGESLGFLFDDDELAKGLAREDALARWREFLGSLGDAAPAEPDVALELDRVDRLRAIPVVEPNELVLDDPVVADDLVESDAQGGAGGGYFDEVDLRDGDPPSRGAELPARRAEPNPPEPRAARGAPSSPPLTKFRDLHGAEPPPAASPPRGARLARVRLVKRRAVEPAAGSVLLRLLGCF